MFFESHAHYDDKRFDKDRDELLVSMQNNNFGKVINVGASIPSSEKSVELAEKYDFIYASVGVHPHYVEEMSENDIDVLRSLAKNERVVAIGEIGLDYYYDNSPRDLQVFWFKKQLDLAKELDLPVIIHSRDASQEVLDIIKESGVRKGVIHCFSSSLEIAREYVKMGFYLGVGGVVTYTDSKKLQNIVKILNLDNILLETDSPYLPPLSKKRTRNNSYNLVEISEKIGEILDKNVDEVVRITFENAEKLFFK